ncbi:exported protein [Mycobacteroides abscessus subsp. abscessus]|uniref:heme-binding protein n=1 Tax=Mycobacteroides abscessus TaxID=36809 RepID=UPI000925E3E3|nr:heme-binding protein [Mycobacteroides abscessus]MDM1886884.1 heme-binding protein [Mycobacteroides abscessus]MDM1891505.1 heme-binding protein [Mycobacteroides abscessus]MDO3031530.1 heme-binding protein [Mycobacteroides abscessus subsp. massiliense]MDO3217951.1 heme-binding protein [Mycobacteroides abscessus subsp. abscessus]PVA54692.1 hemophore-related protein [Mycobacteroides abscessus]
MGMLVGRRVVSCLAAMAIGAGAFTLSMGAASANADEIPNCTAADLAGITSGVAAATSVYMYTHPEVNDFFTGLKGKSAQDIKVAVREYMSANPDIREDLRQIRQPMIDFRSRCNESPEAVEMDQAA